MQMTSLTALGPNAITDSIRLSAKIAVIPRRVPKRKEKEKKRGRLDVKLSCAPIGPATGAIN
jgi:hypothetical protein